MELKILIKVIKKNRKKTLIIASLITIIATVGYLIRPKQYQAMFAVTVLQKGSDQSSDYQFDNYYSQEAIDTFTDSLEQWPGNPGLIQTVYKKAGININNQDPSKLIKARKLGPDYLEFRFKAKSPKNAQAIAKSLTEQLASELEKRKTNKKVWFSLDAGEPYIEEAQLPIVIFIPIAALTGLLLGATWSMLVFYWQD
ncbi:MAG: hypothetical protein GF332_01535 [Candidatus Moranbacteria bacterium]|nr:hypothetical protein [Candidatus Moranbacteria bacterium]